MKAFFTGSRVIAHSFFAAALVFNSLSWCEAAAPAGTDKTFTSLPSSITMLRAADWGFSDSDTPPDTFAAVKLTTLPTNGMLQMDGVNATAGQIISLGPAGVTWTPCAASGSRLWQAITSSADGVKLAAVVDGGQIYTSIDSGVTWTPRESNRRWRSITSSADGNMLAAVVAGDKIYTSTDSGVTWTAQDSNRNWRAITSSSDGKKLAAAEFGGAIYTSTDAGVTWIPRASNKTWQAITSSSDGSKLAGVVWTGQIYTSTDSGLTWIARESNRLWQSITSSADGSKLAALAYQGQIYTSTDAGVTWTARESDRYWSSITSSSDGNWLAAAVTHGAIYTSADSGVTWTPRASNREWTAITSSSQGSKLAAAANYGPIHTSIGVVRTLTYNSPSGTGSDSFTFQVQDSSATDNIDITPNTLTFNYVQPKPPNGTDKAFSVLQNSTTTLTAEDWGFSDFDTPPDTFKAVKLATLPSAGAFQVDGIDAIAGQIVPLISAAGASWTQQNASGSRYWQAITSSADGSKLAAVVWDGQIYVSSDFGVSWTARESSRWWQSITSSADGSKLAAVVSYGQIYTSLDYGVTWTPRESYRNWSSITSSADGTKLFAAVNDSGLIYISNDSGANWTQISVGGRLNAIASSKDGSKLAAVSRNGRIYTSTDSGETWTARESVRDWRAITSSADGSKLAAVANNGKIYTSSDAGVIWTARESNRYWISISSSADGSRLAAMVDTGQIYTSSDSGASWTVRESNRSWRSIASSSDGTKLAAVAWNDLIYTSAGTPTAVTYTAPIGAGITDLTFQVQDSAAIDNLDISPNTLSFNLIQPTQPRGTDKTFSVLPNSTTPLTQADWGFSDTDSPAQTFSAVKLTSLPSSGALKVDGMAATIGQVVTFLPYGPAGNMWSRQEITGVQNWVSITSSADGSKLAAVAQDGQIHTSTDYGRNWAARELNRNWTCITSSANGSKLAAVVALGQIHTSTDSGLTWTARDSERLWQSITSSADGSKLASVVYGGQIYTSIDSGASWTARESNRSWLSIACSADGSKLAAVVDNGQIYISSDSGANWTPRESSRQWGSISSSADGNKLAAVVNPGRIYTSSDSGLSWTPRESSRDWYSITSSADGSKLAAVVLDGQIYTSIDSGANWTPRESTRRWTSISSSEDGSRLATVTFNDDIYTSVGPVQIITYTAPTSIGSSSFTFQVQDSATTNNLDLSPNTLTFNHFTVNPTATLPATPSGGWLVNPLTNRYDIDVPVQNTTGSVINGFRLHVDLSAYANRFPIIMLSNINSPNGTTPAYVDYNYPLAVGQTATKRLSFSVYFGVLPNPFVPSLSVSTLSPPAVGGPLPSGLNFSGAAAQRNNSGPFLMSWQSTPGRWYRIYYSNDLQQWFSASTPIQATSSQTQWSDTGPPHTNAPPASARFYKVSEIAAP